LAFVKAWMAGTSPAMTMKTGQPWVKPGDDERKAIGGLPFAAGRTMIGGRPFNGAL